MKRLHVFIFGDVVGVGFRAWTVGEASSLGLRGWVRNADMNTVEAIFEGDKEKTDQMIELCHKGPEGSWVEKVKVKEEKVIGEFDDFGIRF